MHPWLAGAALATPNPGWWMKTVPRLPSQMSNWPTPVVHTEAPLFANVRCHWHLTFSKTSDIMSDVLWGYHIFRASHIVGLKCWGVNLRWDGGQFVGPSENQKSKPTFMLSFRYWWVTYWSNTFKYIKQHWSLDVLAAEFQEQKSS